jgi:hypothetical protein
MDKNNSQFQPAVFDAEMELFISPDVLPYFHGEGLSAEIEAAFEKLYDRPSPEEFYESISLLIFHARHLRPFEHAHLAKLIRSPYKRNSGKPMNVELHKAVKEYLFAKSLGLFKNAVEPRHIFVGKTAQRLAISPRVVSHVLMKAEEEILLAKGD